ncbi:MerR family transcriptional regulator [Streptomyces sp. MS06]|uniref:helix-turn-helix domain-containing protein n=1 Tax=Streptomyces sp. MS06 TaxID=3385974 RepID=UPI00399F74AE
MSDDELWSIGRLAERAGTTVKTVRFYSDRGLLPEAARSTGGHRRYDPAALDRLRLIRDLRALDLTVPQVHHVLTDQDGGAETGGALEDALAGRLSALGSQLTALRWRETALRLVLDCPPGERPDRLRLVGALPLPPSTAAPARFWRGWLPPRTPERIVSAFLAQAVPQPPADPTPEQALAFARLHALTARPCAGGTRPQPDVHRAAGARGATVLYAGLAEAYELAGARMRRGRAPHPGEALDAFAAAYAEAYGTPDTPRFRRLLAGRLTADPRLERYWELAARVATPPGARPDPTPGTAHDWLRAALDAQLTAPAPGVPRTAPPA